MSPAQPPAPLRVLLVDPSLFTGPYDAALTDGLVAAGVDPTWAVRPTRPGDRQEIDEQYVDAFFYRRVDGMTFLPSPLRAVAKGLAHGLGLARLVMRVLATKPDVVHFQWLVVPPADALAIRIIGLLCPVVLTVHDTVPFNGDRLSWLQNLAFDLPIRLSDRVIVHTQAGRGRLLQRGVSGAKLTVIPHGPLRLHATPSPETQLTRSDHRRTFLMFGEIKHYKGLDLLIEAVGMLPQALRGRARFIVAGRPRMDLAPLLARIAALGLGATVEVWGRRLSEPEMADLFAQTDCFVFPYRQIDASGVYFLTKSLRKWMIASRVGIFAEDLAEGAEGRLIPPENPTALAEAIADAITRRPTPAAAPATPLSSSSTATTAAAAVISVWRDIGQATRTVYQQARGAAHGT